MKYKTILWDIDGTLLNFEMSERISMEKCLEKHGVTMTETQFEEYKKINKECWKMIEKDHSRRNELMVKRFVDFFKLLNVSIDGVQFNKDYQEALGTYYCLNENALEVILALKPHCKQYAASNGSKVAQLGKLKGTGLYDLFDDIFISEDVGYEKPDITYFNYIKQKTHYDPDTTIIIGDSLTSDIKGGENAGIDTCYFNPGHQKNTSQAVTYEIDKLIEVLDIVK